MKDHKKFILPRLIVGLFLPMVAGFQFAYAATQEQGAVPAAANTSLMLTDAVPGLQGGIHVDNMQTCIANVKKKCDQFQRQAWEQYDSCVQQVLNARPNLCLQTKAVYQKEGLLPQQVQAIGPVAVFTLYHLGDGQQTFHMIDQPGHIIDLVSGDSKVLQASQEYKNLDKKAPGAGVMQLVAGPVTQVPQVIMPKPLANKKHDDVVQLIFPQLINNPPCNACQNVAVADISYRFSRDGQFLGVEWLKTTFKDLQSAV